MYRVAINDEERAKDKAALLQTAPSLKYPEEGRSGVNLLEEENQSSRKESFLPILESQDDYLKLLEKQASS